jgi:hypothetical protein
MRYEYTESTKSGLTSVFLKPGYDLLGTAEIWSGAFILVSIPHASVSLSEKLTA